MMLGQRIINAILRPLFALFLPYDVEGQDNLPAEGPVIVMINHINLLDVVIPGMFLPRDVVMLSKVEVFDTPVLGLFARAYGALPLRRGEADVGAIRLALSVLKKGQVLVIAPEGTRSESGKLQPGRDGLAFVATRANVPVVPMVMYGHEGFAKRLARLRRTPLHIRVGEPFRFELQGRQRRVELRAMTEQAMYRLAQLLPPEYRGIYADLERMTDDYAKPYRPSRTQGMA